MTTIGRLGTLAAVAALTLSACGGGGDDDPVSKPSSADPWKVESLDGAKAVIVEASKRIADDDYAGACDLVVPARRAATCEQSMQGLKAENMSEFPVTTDQVGKPTIDATGKPVQGTGPAPCAYKFNGESGYLPGFGSAAVIYLGNTDGWAIYDVGSLDSDEFAGDTEESPEDFIRSYSCPA